MPVPMVSPYLIAGGGALGLLNYLEQKKNYGAQLRAAQEAREREAEIQKFSPWTKRQGQVINNPGAPSLWGNILQGAGTGVALAPLTDMMIKDPADATQAQAQTEAQAPSINPYEPMYAEDEDIASLKEIPGQKYVPYEYEETPGADIDKIDRGPSHWSSPYYSESKRRRVSK